MTNPNDPAFEPLIWKQMPLTKREYFAAMAMQGLLASNHWKGLNGLDMDREVVASIQLADALIAELSKESK